MGETHETTVINCGKSWSIGCQECQIKNWLYSRVKKVLPADGIFWARADGWDEELVFVCLQSRGAYAGKRGGKQQIWLLY